MKLPATTAHLSLAPAAGGRLRHPAPAPAPGIEPAIGPCGLAIGEAVAACGGSVVATYLANWHPGAIVGSGGVCLSALIKVYRICWVQRQPQPEQQALLN